MRHDQDLPGDRHAIGKRYDHVPVPIQQRNGLYFCGTCRRSLTPVLHHGWHQPHYRHLQRRRSQSCTRGKRHT